MNVVVVHRGARDSYQAALAMADAGRLERLVTDIYWHPDSLAARGARAFLGERAAKLLGAHAHSPLDPRQVTTLAVSGWSSFLLDKWPQAPFAWRSRATRATDHALGRAAGKLARATGSALLSYSYYGQSAFAAAGPETPRLLFQLHPHPRSMRRILRRELAAHPDCATSLEREWELALPEAEFARLCEEPRLAQHLIAASSFTRRTLIENGAAPASVHVAPYGVDLDRFHPAAGDGSATRPLRVLFVGTVNQRKGIKYLLEAARRLGSKHVELVIRGRAVDDLQLVRALAPGADIRLSVSPQELLEAYRGCDLFVFPSLGEGFGHVLIEALASGLPVLSTTHTAALDLVTEGADGFVVEPGDADALATRLEWALSHRPRLAAMRQMARAKAEQFTWARFRRRLGEIVDGALSTASADPRLATKADPMPATLGAEHV